MLVIEKWNTKIKRIFLDTNKNKNYTNLQIKIDLVSLMPLIILECEREIKLQT